MKIKRKKPELLAPVGNWPMLKTAVKAGADAVYFGVESLNMRAKAKNFTTDDLPEIVRFCRENGVDTHLTLNTIIYDDELDELERITNAAKSAGITMIICWDQAVIQKCVEKDIPFCISTQASIANSAAAEYYKNLGASRIVLARECALNKIKNIIKNVDIEVETFVHGAMCVAVSGRCFLSHEVFGKSANRGECLQPCRREYKIYDDSGESEFYLGEDYIMSPKDLNAIKFIDQLIEAGIRSFKIEGRKRSPEYILQTVSVYRKAIDLWFEGKLSEEVKEELFTELGKVYNRGFSDGFYFGRPGSKEFAEQYGSRSETRKEYLGIVLHYYPKAEVAHILLEAGDLTPGDPIYIIGNATGVVKLEPDSLFVDDKPAEKGLKKEEVTFKCPEKLRLNDKVYKIVKTKYAGK